MVDFHFLQGFINICDFHLVDTKINSEHERWTCNIIYKIIQICVANTVSVTHICYSVEVICDSDLVSGFLPALLLITHAPSHSIILL